jgi:hypothetical protein
MSKEVPQNIYGEEQLPGAAHIEDFRPGALVKSYHDGQPDLSQITVTSYPYTMLVFGRVSVWVDIESNYPDDGFGGGPFTRIDSMSLADTSVVPLQEGKYAGQYNKHNVAKLVEPAPVRNPALPKSLRGLLEQPYADLADDQKLIATKYFMGQQAIASLLREERQGVPQPPLTYFSIGV